MIFIKQNMSNTKVFFSIQLILMLICNITLLGQDIELTDSIEWKKPQEIKISKYDTQKQLYFSNAQYGNEYGGLPYISKVIQIKNRAEVVNLQIAKSVYSALSSEELSLIPENAFNESEAVIQFGTVLENKKPFLEYRIYPYRKVGGRIEKLVTYSLVGEYGNAISNSRAKASSTQSVLANGKWIKIGVTSSGIFKLSKQQLSAIGFDVSSDPRNAKIYGNGGAQLPERNNLFYPDDLTENAIYFKGESDGSFDDSDYILFYAQGPVSWSYDNVKGIYRHSRNIYCDTTWYFINTSSGNGRRIALQSESELTPSSIVSVYDNYGFIENNDENLLKSGRRWFGNKMESTINSHSFNLTFPNATSGPHKITSNLLARNLSATSFGININGQNFSQQVSALTSLGYLDTFAKENETVFIVNSDLSSLNISVTKANSTSTAWIDYLIFNIQCNLTLNGSQLSFRKQDLISPGTAVEYKVTGTNSSTQIWEITDYLNIRQQMVQSISGGSALSFVANADSLREWIAVNTDGVFPSPINGGVVPNQNLHGISQVDLIIVAPNLLINNANTLADHHRNHDNMRVAVVTPQQVYNEFSSGNQDISAIRNFVRMFYERANSPEDSPKYLLLMGDGSYDPRNRIPNNQNLIPTYESVESLNPIGSFCSDDFYGFMDPTEGGSIQSVGAGLLDIGIGRMPVNTPEEASMVINKVIHYTTSQSCMNDWRNLITFIADDEDNGEHVNQAEIVSALVHQDYPVYNVDKIYLDAYQQENGSGGQRYPQVNTDITNRVERGSLMMNYAGHGGEESLALERVITIDGINSWESFDNLTLFMTATCEFSRFDNPGFTSAGEYVILNPMGGGVALFTTLRLTFSSSNSALNRNIMNTLFLKDNGNHLRVGEILRRGKNATGSSFNNRSFALLGDPAMLLAYPTYDVYTTSINGSAITAVPDTISALDLVTITGFVGDDNGQILSDFNGVVTPTVFDKAATYYTLGNDAGSPIIPFQLQKNVIFRGPATVTNGQFSFSFVVPQDIQFNFGSGKLSYYARKNNTLIDAHGAYEGIQVGGFSSNPTTDDTGPIIKLYMNNTKFVDNGMTDENPVFLAYVEDDIGINTVGTGIGHDITAILDEDASNPIVLNDFYESELDNFRKGIIKYPLRDLAVGPHTITLKVWDVANNSSTATLRFNVIKSEELSLNHVLNYPNPFTTNTQFFFEYNQPGVPVDVDIQIFTVSGKNVKTLRSTQISNGFRSDPIVWNGLDDFGDRIGRGVYMYRLRVKTPDGKSAEKFEKLVILQ
jgi:hypothetical protein